MSFEKIIKHTQKWEGGLSRHNSDTAKKNACPTPYKGKTGWHTNKGVTYAAWVSVFGRNRDAEFFEMSDENWLRIYFIYWKAVNGDKLLTGRIEIAYFMTQIAWGSGIGSKQAGLTAQRAANDLNAGLKVDGEIGPKTIAAILSLDARDLFDRMVVHRVEFFKKVAAKNGQSVFLKGWLNRLEDFRKTFRPEKLQD